MYMMILENWAIAITGGLIGGLIGYWAYRWTHRE
jgi:hypothetical protein